MNAGVTAYAEDVRSGRYPEQQHGYSIDAAAFEDFSQHLT